MAVSASRAISVVAELCVLLRWHWPNFHFHSISGRVSAWSQH